MVEKIMFNLLAIVLFAAIFFIMARRNDTNYISLLIAQALGIAINFLELNFHIFENIGIKIIEYLLAIILPIIILIMEKRKINYSELIALAKIKILIVKGDTETARTILVHLVTKYPESYLGRKTLAEIYELQEKYEDAMVEYYRAVDLNSNDFTSNYKIAELLNKIGKNKEAENTLNDLLKRNPSCYEASTLLGDMLYSQQRYKEAINVYMEALRYKPEDYFLYYNLGMVYIGLNDFQNAKTCYEKAAEINSRLYKAYYTLGQLSLIANDLEEAEKYFVESLYDEMEADSYYELARIYMLKNEREKAITFIQKAIEVDVKYVKIARKEPIFIPIKQYIVEPEIINEPKSELSPKEVEIKENLAKTAAIVEKIGFKQREEKMEKNTKKMR